MKDWKGNSKSTFVNIGASSHSATIREANDYYATDPTAIDDLFQVETFDENVWECAGGVVIWRIECENLEKVCGTRTLLIVDAKMILLIS